MRAAYLAPLVGALSFVAAPLAGAMEKPGAEPKAQAQVQEKAEAKAKPHAGRRRGDVEGHGAECNPINPGAVHIKMFGAPGDSFSVTLKCGATQVARCIATVPAGGVTASCTDTGTLVKGEADCSLGSGHGNTGRADARDWGCAY